MLEPKQKLRRVLIEKYGQEVACEKLINEVWGRISSSSKDPGGQIKVVAQLEHLLFKRDIRGTYRKGMTMCAGFPKEPGQQSPETVWMHYFYRLLDEVAADWLRQVSLLPGSPIRRQAP
jgi:hypothetical protein